MEQIVFGINSAFRWLVGVGDADHEAVGKGAQLFQPFNALQRMRGPAYPLLQGVSRIRIHADMLTNQRIAQGGVIVLSEKRNRSSRKVQRLPLVAAYDLDHVSPGERVPVSVHARGANRRPPGGHNGDGASHGRTRDEGFVALHVDDDVILGKGGTGCHFRDAIGSGWMVRRCEHGVDPGVRTGLDDLVGVGRDDAGVGDVKRHHALVHADHKRKPSEQAERLVGEASGRQAGRDHGQDGHQGTEWDEVAARFTPCKIRSRQSEGKRWRAVTLPHFLYGMPTLWWWVGFNALILTLLALDLGVFNRTSHAVSVREALGWSAVWISLAVAFGLWIGQSMGRVPMLEFYAGYLVEQALSVDNLFVFILIFGYFQIPPALQHRVLFWGILGALIMRGVMIGAGAALLAQFHWIIYLFGAFLVYTGFKMATGGDAHIEPESNPVIRVVRRFLPITAKFRGERFFVRESLVPGERVRLVATPLFIVLALVETTDLVFALDSIPAIFGVTRNPFLVYTSNVFAILGLRSMYFVLANVITKFHLLKYGLALVLSFVGAKMLLSELYPLGIGLSLGVVVTVLAGSVVLSLVIPAKRSDADVPSSERTGGDSGLPPSAA